MLVGVVGVIGTPTTQHPPRGSPNTRWVFQGWVFKGWMLIGWVLHNRASPSPHRCASLPRVSTALLAIVAGTAAALVLAAIGGGKLMARVSSHYPPVEDEAA